MEDVERVSKAPHLVPMLLFLTRAHLPLKPTDLRAKALILPLLHSVLGRQLKVELSLRATAPLGKRVLQPTLVFMQDQVFDPWRGDTEVVGNFLPFLEVQLELAAVPFRGSSAGNLVAMAEVVSLLAVELSLEPLASWALDV
jgi:hypothetical protein